MNSFDLPDASSASSPFKISRTSALVALGLTLLTFLTFIPVLHCGYTDFDDPDYVSHNIHVLGGLTLDNVRWAWGTVHAGYWQPLSWLSLMLDSTLFGATPEAYHRTNLALHAMSAGVVFLVLSRLTGTLWRAALIAVLYAVHPLRVESVAWVAERKDVLSNLFAWLTIGGYVAYARQPKAARYLLVLIPFVLGILAKPMVVTLPCLLLLLDYWPLRRSGFWRLLLEKLPLFALAFAAGAAALADQVKYEASLTFADYPLFPRLVTMADGYVLYIWKMVWFSGLAIFYPLPSETRAGPAAIAALFLFAVTGWTFLQRKQRPWLIVGWLWFLGVLFPVSGIFQAGSQSMADRFSYLPCVGLLIMLVWSIPRIKMHFAVPAAAGAISCLVAASWIQCGYWQNTETAFSHALQVTQDNWLAHDQVGLSMYQQGNQKAALEHWHTAAKLNAFDPTSQYNLGLACCNAGQDDLAITHFNQALKVRPYQCQTHTSLGVCLARRGDLDGAFKEYKRSLDLNPQYEPAHSDLGGLLARIGLLKEAEPELDLACRLDPTDKVAIRNLLTLRNQMRAGNVADMR